MSLTFKQRTRLTATILVVCFLLSDISYAAAFEAVPVDVRKDHLLPEYPARFEAPVEFSTLEEVYKGDGGTFLIHIQDPHANLSGQENLANTLDALMSRYGVSLVLVEGGTKDDTLTPLKKIA